MFCDSMNCSTPGFPVLHHLSEFSQTCVQWVVMPSNHLILYHPLLLLPSIFSSIRVFSKESALHIGGQSIGVSASTSVLPMNIQDRFPLGLTSLISLQSKGLSRVFSNTTFKSINSSMLSFMVQLSHAYMTTEKNHSFDWTDLCPQSNISTF